MKCYYCGEDANDKDEHIPPRSLYRGKNTFLNSMAEKQDFIVVPSCKDHNTNTSKADDIFAFILADWAFGSQFATNVMTSQLDKLENLKKKSKTGYELFVNRMSAIGISQMEIGTGKKIIDASKFPPHERRKFLQTVMNKIYKAIIYTLNGNHYSSSPEIDPDWYLALDQTQLERLQKLEYEWSRKIKPQIIISGCPEVFKVNIYNRNRMIITFYNTVFCLIELNPETR